MSKKTTIEEIADIMMAWPAIERQLKQNRELSVITHPYDLFKPNPPEIKRKIK